MKRLDQLFDEKSYKDSRGQYFFADSVYRSAEAEGRTGGNRDHADIKAYLDFSEIEFPV